MKKSISVILVMSIMAFSDARACDICGCGVSNYYIGILPQFNHAFFGVRYHFSHFNTRLKADPTQFSNDFYQTTEIWGGWNIGSKFRILAFVPYNFNRQNSDEGVSNKNGLGDVIVLANYKVFDATSMAGSNAISQQLWIGAGLKLPTGKFDINASDPDVAAIANGQLGSGSTDVLVNTLYNVRINKFGMNASASYKINSANREQFRFGNKLALSDFIYCALPVSKTVISPNVGLLYDKTKESELQQNKVDLTGGYILNGSIGTELSFKKVAIGFNVQVPLAQNFAENQTKEKIKGMIHFTVAI